MNGEKQAAEKYHGKAKKVGKGLGFKDLTDGYRDKEAQEGRGYGNEQYAEKSRCPVDAGQVNQKGNISPQLILGGFR